MRKQRRQREWYLQSTLTHLYVDRHRIFRVLVALDDHYSYGWITGRHRLPLFVKQLLPQLCMPFRMCVVGIGLGWLGFGLAWADSLGFVAAIL